MFLAILRTGARKRVCSVGFFGFDKKNKETFVFLAFVWKGARKGSAAVGFFGFFKMTSRNPTDKIKTPPGRGGGREGKAETCESVSH